MRRRLALIGFLGLAAGLVICGPALAVSFENTDLDGNWSLNAFGAYDVKGILYYGTISLDDSGFVTGSANGAYGWAEADYTGGGLSLNSTGQVSGVIRGRSAHGSFEISLKLGWMDLTKNEITFLGVDNNGVQLMAVMVKTN